MKKNVSRFAYILPVGILVLCEAHSAFAQSLPPGAVCSGLQAVQADIAGLGNGMPPPTVAAAVIDLRGSVTGPDAATPDDAATISAIDAMALDSDPLSGGPTAAAATDALVATDLATAEMAVGGGPNLAAAADAGVAQTADAGLRQLAVARIGPPSAIGNAATFLLMQISAFETQVDSSLRGLGAALGDAMADSRALNRFSSPSYQLRGIVPSDAGAASPIINAVNGISATGGVTAADSAVRADGIGGVAYGNSLSIRTEKTARAVVPTNAPA